MFLRGVWVSDRPLDISEFGGSPKATVVLKVSVRIDKDQLDYSRRRKKEDRIASGASRLTCLTEAPYDWSRAECSIGSGLMQLLDSASRAGRARGGEERGYRHAQVRK